MSLTTSERLKSPNKDSDEVEAEFEGTALNLATGKTIMLVLRRAYRWTTGPAEVVFVLVGSDGNPYNFNIGFWVFDPETKIYAVGDPEIRHLQFYESDHERYLDAESGTVDLKNNPSERYLAADVQAVTMTVDGIQYQLSCKMTSKGPFPPAA